MIVAMDVSPPGSHRPGDDLPARLTVAANPASLRSLRVAVAAAALDADAPQSIVDEFELIVSELATNVIQHTAAEQITVVFDRVADGWMIDVSDADGLDVDTLATLATAGTPDPSRLSGRGLFIVQSIMDTVELVDIGGHQHLRCCKRASA